MRKALSLVVLLTFAWLQGYQLADASEDTAEALQDGIVASIHSPTHTAIDVPDDEYDTAVPLVAGQTLQPGHIELAQRLIHQAVPTFSQPAHAVAVQQFIQNKSPPGTYLSANPQPLTSLALDRTPAHTLAPPLA